MKAGIFVVAAMAASAPLLKQAHQAVSYGMVDPDSAKFRMETVSPQGTVCGEVNSKNRMGGYVGFVPYTWSASGGTQISDGPPPPVFMPRTEADAYSDEAVAVRHYCPFVVHWRMVCSEESAAAMLPLVQACEAINARQKP